MSGPGHYPAPRRQALELQAQGEALAHVGSWRVHVRTLEGTLSDGLCRILGLEPQREPFDPFTLRALIHPDDRHAAEALVELATEHPERLPTKDIVSTARLLRPDGEVRDVQFCVRIERDEHGAPEFFAGVLHDTTPQRELTSRLSAHRAVNQVLRGWAAFDLGVVDLMRRAGGALGLSVGEFWTWSADTERIVCRAFWSAPDMESGDFELVTRQLSREPGQGAIGAVWEAEKPLVIPDLYDELDPCRAALAARLGLASALVFPAVGPHATLAVIVYYGTDRIQPSAGLIETLEGIGHEIGHFLSGRRGELEPPDLTRREVEVLQHAADGHSGPEIARRLMIETSTVKTHFERVYEKAGVGDRAAAVAYALRLGLIV
jgi:DNA-binding CsgD family transcriptional regulator